MFILEDLKNVVPGSANAIAVDISSTDQALSPACQGVYVGTSGDVKVTTVGGQTVTFKSVPVGFLNVRCTAILKAGTTAANLIALR